MKSFIVALTVVGLLLLAPGAWACGSSKEAGQSAGGEGSQGTAADDDTAHANADPSVDAAESRASMSARRAALSPSARRAVRAVRQAARKVGRGRPYDLESERYRGRPVWDVDVASRPGRPYHLIISSNGTEVLRRVQFRRSNDDVPKVLRAKVSLVKAIRIADRRASGRLEEADIDRSRGRIVWDVSFERGNDGDTEVTVDAMSGKVLRVEVDAD